MKKLRLNFKDALDYKEHMMRAKQKFKAASIGFAVTAIICAGIPTTYASDIEIYKVPEDAVGNTTLMMMLDLSGSMGWGEGYTIWNNNQNKYVPYTSMSVQEDYGVCSGTNTGILPDTATTSYYTRYYCPVTAVVAASNSKVTDTKTGCEKQTDNSYRCYDRLTRLKDGLRQTLLGTQTVPKIDDKIIVGLSTFAGNNGYVRVPARALGTVLNSTTIQEPYTETETYTEQEPYTETETYTEQEPYVVQEACVVNQEQTFNKPRWRMIQTRSFFSSSTKYQTCNGGWTADYVCKGWSGESTSKPTGFPGTTLSNEYEGCGFLWSTCKTEYYEVIKEPRPVNTTCPVTKYRDVTRTRQVTKYREVTKTRIVTKYRDKVINTTQRDLLLTTLKDLNANGGTPTPYAYAEAAAYLMGTNTNVSDYNIRYYQSLGNRQTNGTSNYPCKSPLNPTNSYRTYKKPDGSPIIIRWCEDSNKSWTPPAGSTSLVYDFTNNANRELFYAANDPRSSTASDGATYSGWTSSQQIDNGTNSITGSTNYVAPTSIAGQKDNAAQRECSGQGIYFLTDGQPEPNGWAVGDDGTSGTAYALMRQSLGDKSSLFTCNSSPLGSRTGYSNLNNSWACIGKYAQALLAPAKNPAGVKVKTAVVGFGSSFGGGTTASDDVEDAKTWGTIGEGGWIAGSKPEDVSNSINKFVGDLIKDIPSMSTGSSTIPVDALNPAAVQPYSYFPQFEPKVNPADKQQIWFGNLKKYYVLNSSVYAGETASDNNLVVKKSKLQDLADIWAKGGIDYPASTPIFKKGGALSRLPLGTGTNAEGQTTTARNLLTDYSYDGTKAESERVTRDFDLVKINYTYTSNDKTKTDTTYASALMSLLGYNISSDTNTNGLDLSTQTAEVRQMGSIMHSNPVLLTQEGKATATKDSTTGKISVGSTGREDYVLFGTTQGLVQVVDATTGVEKFAFVPKEIIERQSETFKNGGGNLAGGKEALYYGIDGEWTAHTVYVTKANGTLTVKGTARDADSEEKENLSGKQWVYGGMRMGGRSYYALDLTDINNPKIKFHIDPSTSKVYNKDNPSGTTFTALAKMGQSWSKPTLGYVNWKGKRKLVMFVGGGYDAGGVHGDGLYAEGIRTGYAGYETYNYNQDNKIGAGVYMFDADSGDLLWNADSDSNSELKYSVASQIRAIDRNNDGMIDHVYFGDLAGQAFRVDFKNDGSKTAFTTQTTRILNLHQTDGTSPRFYTLPVFTAHYSAGSEKIYGGNIVLVTFVSGNKSSPLLATSDSPQKKDPSGLQYDGAYAIYDYDVYPSTSEGRYPSSNMAARTLAATTATDPSATQLRYINDATTTTTIDKTSGWGGWYYLFNKKFDDSNGSASIIKALTNPIALEGSLYVTQFDASNNGTTSSCGAGVKGHSFAQRLCLPTGVCKEDANYRYNLGSGIVTLNVGGGTDNDVYKRSLVVPDPNDICTGPNCKPCKGNDCVTGKNFLNTGGALKLIPNRWYEKYARQEPSS
nr:hypothetical protein [Alkanindiges illinoisensis]